MEPIAEGKSFRHLLIPLDGTAMAEAVVPSAARLASQCGAHVTLLHLIERHAPTAVHGRPHLTARDEAQAYLESVAHRYFPDTLVNLHVHTEETSDVASSVTEHVGEFRPDLIVMCAHDHEGWWKWFWGSVGQQVVRLGHTPVLLFRWVDGLSPEFPFRHVLVPLDGDPEHESGVRIGGEMARLSGGHVDLLQVVPTLETMTGPGAVTRSYVPGATRMILDLAVEQAREYLQGQMKSLETRGVTCEAMVARGDRFDEITAHVRHAGNDLVVLGTHGKIGTKAFWAGSLGQQLLDNLMATFLLAPVESAD